MKTNSSIQNSSLVLLRVLIGWHLLYEGLVKILDPDWTSEAFLDNAQGPFSAFFKHLASDNTLLLMVDFLNEWGLVLIGLSLFLGFLTRVGVISGIVLLSLYYLANPPFSGYVQNTAAEGNYLIVNKNLIEIGGLFVLLVFKSHRLYGFDRFFVKK